MDARLSGLWVAALAVGCQADPVTAPGAASTATVTVASPPSATAAPRHDEVAEARRASSVRSDEEVLLFPGLGRQEAGVWKVSITAWIFEPEVDSSRRQALIDAVREVTPVADGSDEARQLEATMRPFLVDNERSKRLRIELLGQVHELPPSGEDGFVEAELSIPSATVSSARATARVLLRPDDSRSFEGEVHFVGAQGTLLVSDVDDTVKRTEVRDRAALLRNVFLRPVQPFPDVAAFYGRLLRPGDHLHYVSGSPWQLQGALDVALRGAGFPAATYDLRRIRPSRVPVLELLADPEQGKLRRIEPLFAWFPARRFVLVGDSGEKDPEVYGALYRDHPKQVEHIYVRDVTGEPATDARYVEAFRGVPAGAWTLFTDPAKLP